jgi:ParB family chromosome partitioning protein
MVNRPSGLGRGLGALIPSEVVGEQSAAYLDIPIGDVVPNRYQPRTTFDEEALTGLADSIREVGILQPVLVRPLEDRFELIAGERRWRAAKRAGLTHIPAIVRELEEMGSLQNAIVENLHRADLNALDEAAAYRQLIDDFSLSQDEVASRVGKSRSSVTNTLRLMHLSPKVQRLLVEGDLTAGHGRALLAVEDSDAQLTLAKTVIKEGMSVRQAEQLCKVAPEPKAKPVRKLKPRVTEPGVLELEEVLAEQLSTHVTISMKGQRGKVVVDFADLDDLERIYRLMSGL